MQKSSSRVKLETSPNGLYALYLKLPGYTLDVLLNSEGRNIQILVLLFDEEIHSPCPNSTNLSKLYDSSVHFTRSIKTNFV